MIQNKIYLLYIGIFLEQQCLTVLILQRKELFDQQVARIKEHVFIEHISGTNVKRMLPEGYPGLLRHDVKTNSLQRFSGYKVSGFHGSIFLPSPKPSFSQKRQSSSPALFNSVLIWVFP